MRPASIPEDYARGVCSRSIKDLTGLTPGSAPDGKSDAHFSIELAASYGPVYLWHVNLVSSGFWATNPNPAGGEGLAVFLDGKRLNFETRMEEACAPPRGGGCWPDPRTWLDLHWSTKPMHVDLYAADTGRGAFQPGRAFRFWIGGTVPFSTVPVAGVGEASATLTLPGA